MVDYWVIRKTKVNVPQLYTEAKDGEYFYHRGVNWRAIGAFIPASVISLVFALVPAFAGFSEFLVVLRRRDRRPHLLRHRPPRLHLP
jgi:NCS1 family nucleobase:cation symporter-1